MYYNECELCEYEQECNDKYDLCRGCINEDSCPLQSVFCMCKKGLPLQCNNGYEEQDW